VEAYQVSRSSFSSRRIADRSMEWSGPAKTWQQIGQVVDAIGSGRKQLYEGKEYDYVFDVDVSEGIPPLKLPYNVTGQQAFRSCGFAECSQRIRGSRLNGF